MTPLAFWECMENGRVKSEYLQQLPEEFKSEFEPIVIELENKYSQIQEEINEDLKKLPTTELTREGRKAIGLFIKSNNLRHGPALFPHLLGGANKYIMNHIRPTGNVMVE